MVERYHLVLAAQALGVGIIVAMLDLWAPRSVSVRCVGLAVLAGSLLGGWGNPRALPWVLGAVVVTALPDHGTPPHPLGRWTVVLAMASLVGVWSAVPDTEPALAAGAALAAVAVTRAAQGRAVGPVGMAALLVAVLGSVWVGSAGWGSALCVSCAIGMVLVAPIVVGFHRDRLVHAGWWAVVVGHLAVALVVPRLIMNRPVPVAAAVAAASLAALAMVCLMARTDHVAARTPS